jgi:hypothetical protein
MRVERFAPDTEPRHPVRHDQAFAMMLHAPGARVLDVPLACGFKTQQHSAQVFRDVWGVIRTEYGQHLLGSEATCASETWSEDTPLLVICV